MAERRSSEDAVYRFGEFELNSAERGVYRNGTRVPLTPRAFHLLQTLVEADGRLLSKEALLSTVWADAVVEEGNLNRTISSIRKALGDGSRDPRFIETIPKAGYRFVAPVERVPATNAKTHGAVNTPVEAIGADDAWTAYKFLFGIAAVIFLVGIVAATYLFSPPTPPPVTNEPRMMRLTNNEFNEDQASWTTDGQIRFIRYVTATRGESWVMNADGSNQRRANELIRSLQTGLWSPDGRQVVFVKEGEGPRNVYLANADGSNERRLPLNYPPAAWSPDGTKFVYGSPMGPGNFDIYLYDIASDKSTNITNSPAFEADPQFSPDGMQIAFVSNVDGNNEAYVVNLDGTGQRRLTDHPAVDAFPTFAPDGTQIAFDSNREGENVDIYIKNVNDDSAPVKLTNLSSNEERRAGCWSPDGTKLVITSDQSGKSNIYLIDVEPYTTTPVVADPGADLQYPSFSPDGRRMIYQARYDDKSLAVRLDDRSGISDERPFRSEPAAGNFNLTPVFSPSGDRIAFTNKINGNTEICTMNLKGGDIVNLTNDPGADASPRFSPDGTKIIFQSNRDGAFERFHLFTMNADGSEQRRISSRQGYEFSPFITGSGTIVFAGDRVDETSRSLDIRALNIDDPTVERVVASRRFHDTQPVISPDGVLVAFVSQSDGNQEIYLVRMDGGGLVRLTRNTGDDMSPTFSADGTKIYFSSNRNGRYGIYELPLAGSSSPVISR